MQRNGRRSLPRISDGPSTAFALILTVGLAMRQLLSPADLANLPTYAGGIIALTLIGWAIGGMAAGVVAD